MEHNDFIELSTEQQELVSAEQAWHYSIVPKAMLDHKLALFISDQVDGDELLDELEILFGCEVELEAIQDEIIKKTLSKYYRGKKKSTRKVKAIDGKNAEDFLDQLIVEANELGSSDIHIETFDSRCRVRIRIDGMLVERYTIKKDDYPALINKIKIKSNLDISEKRLPQDGRIIFKSAQDKFDIRVSVLPTLHGEKVVLRLLSNDATEIDIKELGFGEEELRNYMEGVKKPHGILLISGPTGSGKTTTLYATLKLLNDEKTNIMTVEDPIEYTLEGINQVQLKESIGLNFASALRTFLRQDPDVIMVGEIRDGETAQIAVRAALTGHLVLSTIHTNSAWGTVSHPLEAEPIRAPQLARHPCSQYCETSLPTPTAQPSAPSAGKGSGQTYLRRAADDLRGGRR